MLLVARTRLRFGFVEIFALLEGLAGGLCVLRRLGEGI